MDYDPPEVYETYVRNIKPNTEMIYDATQDCNHPDFDPMMFPDLDPEQLLTFNLDEQLPEFQFQSPTHSPETQSVNATSHMSSEGHPSSSGGEMKVEIQDTSLQKSAPVSNSTSTREGESILELPEKPMEGENIDEAPALQTRHISIASDTARQSASHVMEHKYSNQGAVTSSQSLTRMEQGYTNTGETVNPYLVNMTGQVGNYSSLPVLHTPIPGPRTWLQNPGFQHNFTTTDSLQSLAKGTAEPSHLETAFNESNNHDPLNGHVAVNYPEGEIFEGFPESPNNLVAPPGLLSHHSPSSEEALDVELKPIVRDATDCDRIKPWVRLNITKGKNYRAAKIEAYRPERAYTSIPYAPTAWGHKYKYKYHSTGELEAPAFYSPKGIHTFLFQNPAHSQYNGQSGLRLWIQRNPPDSARRYGQAQASRCRFRECPAPNRSIVRGEVRVAFDELSFAHRDHDPQHNAGYVHLYCIEKFLDFPAICHLLDVRVDTRVLPKEPDGRNRMMLSYDEERELAAAFLTICKIGRLPPGYPHYLTPNRPYEGTLTHRLIKARLKGELKMHKQLRAYRGTHGKSIVDHLGNLEARLGDKVDNIKRKGSSAKTASTKKQKKMDDYESEEDAEEKAHLGDKAENRKRKRPSAKSMPKKKPRKTDDCDSENDAEGEIDEEAIVVEHAKAPRRSSRSETPKDS